MNNVSPFMDRKPDEPEKPKATFTAANWFWAITVAAVFLGPLAIWLYRLAFGL